MNIMNCIHNYQIFTSHNYYTIKKKIIYFFLTINISKLIPNLIVEFFNITKYIANCLSH